VLMKTRKQDTTKLIFFTLSVFLFALLFSAISVSAQYTKEKILNNGNDNNRMVWVIMGDGYTSLEIDDFHNDVDLVMDEFFKASPWNEYKGFINVYRIDVISKESGADHPSGGIYVDTAMDATYETYGIDRLLTVGDAKALEIASSVPSFDAVMIIVNDETYGGSGGTTIVFSNHEKAGRIALHEAGHLIGNLADEYETPYPGYPEGDSEPNVTYQTEFENIPWKDWIEPGTPLPTSDSDKGYGVGVYEGARYLSTGIYRPDHNCTMRSLGAQNCQICAEALIINLYNYVDPIDNYSPDEEDVFLSAGTASSEFKIDLMNSYSKDTAISWEIDGAILEDEDSTTLSVDYSTLRKGTHRVKVSVADYTSLVKNDPQGLLFSSRTWNIEKESKSGVISGRVLNAVSTLGLAGVVIGDEGGNFSTTTNEDGSYLLSLIDEGTYTIVAAAERYDTDTVSEIGVVDGKEITVNFTLNPLYATYSLSGKISGNITEGITVHLQKGAEIYLSSTTEADGSYLFNGLEGGSYTVIPDINNYLFIPSRHDLTLSDEDLSEINFTAQSEACPAEATLEDEDPSQLDPLREFRNRVLAKNKTGKHYTALYYKHAHELAGHIIGHEEIREGSLELILRIMPYITALTEGEEVVMETELLEDMDEFLDSLEPYASPALKRTMKKLRKDMRNEKIMKKFSVISQ
jgi:hypothetical protein